LKLIIDIGNTNAKIALFDGKNFFSAKKLQEFSLINIINFTSNYKIVSTIISTVKTVNDELLKISKYFNAVILNKEILIPIKNKYKSLDTLGNDRLAGVVGANALWPKKNLLVIDAGTCLTIDLISADGEYIGGRISPGIKMRFLSLNTFTDKLPLLKLEKSTPFIGDDTISSIISGVQQGILDEIKSAISDYRAQFSELIVIVTGGDCFYFEKELKKSIFAEPNLVLIGLNEILDFNE
jgi:type III pantothenate kinase